MQLYVRRDNAKNPLKHIIYPIGLSGIPTKVDTSKAKVFGTLDVRDETTERLKEIKLVLKLISLGLGIVWLVLQIARALT